MTVRWRPLLAEYLGTLLLVTIVVGSGIAASRLSPDDVGLQLLENSIATAFGLAVLILVLQPLSGAQFNPVVTVADAVLERRAWREVPGYVVAQSAGAISGAVLANGMFGGAAVSIATTDRLTWPTALAEVVATAGLVAVIFLLARNGRSLLIGPAVGAYIGAAYWFTSSTSFANPAVTLGRVFSDTFAGIAPSSALGFVAAQVLGAAVGVGIVALLSPRRAEDAPGGVPSHHRETTA